MAKCGHCGAEIRDDIWVCSACGQPVATARSASAAGAPGSTTETPAGEQAGHGAPAAPTYAAQTPAAGAAGSTSPAPAPGYGAAAPEYGEPLLGASAESTSGAKSRLVWMVGIGGLVAIIAIVLVWAFALRGGPGGDPTPYLGTWTIQLPATMSTSGVSSLSVIVSRQGDGAELSLSAQGQTMGPYKTTVEADRLVTKLEASDSATDVQKQASDMARSMFGSMVSDFQMVLRTTQSADTLTMAIEGKVQGEKIDSSNQTLTLTRVATQ